MKKISKILLVVMLFMICPVVNAAEIDHFYSKSGEDVMLTDNTNSSAMLAGLSVEASSKVKGIVGLAGNDVVLSGEADYAALAGNNIEIEGTVNNDAFVAGNLITTTSSSRFNRDVIIAGSDVELSGNFARNISVYASKVTIKNANIKGNIKIYSAKVIIEQGIIEGTLSYPEDAVTKISDNVIINNTVKTEPINTQEEADSYWNTISSKIWSFACYALVFAVLCLLFPKIINKLNEQYEKLEFNEVIEILTIGLVVILLIPVISVLLMFTGIGLPLSIISIVLYFIGIYLSTVFTAYLLGYKIWQKVFNKDMNMLLIGLIGLFILLILNIIPGIRYFVSIITILVGLGMIFRLIKKAR